ncbi:MAG TPA: hypothetical protein VF550_17215 [Polyangia bacterium]
MITDPIPRAAKSRRQYEASDAQPHLALPPAEPFQTLAADLALALATEQRPKVKKAGAHLLAFLAQFYQVAPPKLSVLGARPKQVSEGSSYELWGDYTFATEAIRVWMRTAVLGKVTSFRGLLNTLLHEFCHHLDVKRFGWPDTPHTRGFFCRIDDLYHMALATPADQRRPLVWIKGRNTWRIDWTKLRSQPATSAKAAPQGTTQAP